MLQKIQSRDPNPSPAFIRMDERTDGRLGREGANEATRWKNRNDNSRNKFVLYFL